MEAEREAGRERERERLLYRLTNLVGVDSLIVKNIGPSSANQWPFTAVTHCICTPETRKKRREESISYTYMCMWVGRVPMG